MKASDIQVGDVIDGWTVTSIEDVSPPAFAATVFVLLELEETSFRVTGQHGEILSNLAERTWYRSDEDVEVER